MVASLGYGGSGGGGGLGNGAGGGVSDGGLGNGGGGGWCESERNEARESGSSVCFPLSDFSKMGILGGRVQLCILCFSLL